LLVKTIGGPSVHPYQPDGVWVPGVTQYVYPQPSQIAPDGTGEDATSSSSELFGGRRPSVLPAK